MATTNALPLSFVMAALEPGRTYTPQQLGEAIAERLQAVAGQTFALFVTGSTEPAYDVGPWAANGNEWKYFDVDVGQYVPFIISQSSLKFYVGADEPDPAVYLFWIELDGDGLPVQLNTYANGAWQPAFYTKAELYTQVEIDAFFEPTVAGKKQIDWDNVINKPSDTRYPARAEQTVTQSQQANGVAVKIALGAELYDIGAVFDTVNSRYVAPVAGIYSVSWAIQVDNDTADAATMQVLSYVIKNGVTNIGGGSTASVSPPGSRWFINAAMEVALAEGDYIELWVEPFDGTGTGLVDISNVYFCISLVQET